MASTDAALPAFQAVVHRPRVPRVVLVGLWLVFMAVLLGAVLGAAEASVRLRRAWVAAHADAPPNTDDRFVADRLLRYANRPSYTYGGGDVHYTNNALGLRGPEISATKPAGVRRVVLVGGSTVYGATDDDADTISVHLQMLLRQDLGPNVEVINGGVPGYDSLREVVFARARLVPLQPDIVIDIDGLNDVYYGSLEEWPSQVAADEIGIIGDGRYPDLVSLIDATVFPHGLLEHQLTMLGRDLRPRLYSLLGRANPAPPRILNERIIALHAAVLGNLARVGAGQGVPVIAALQPLVATGHKTLSPEEQFAVTHGGYWDAGGWADMALRWYPRLAETTRASMQQQGGSFVDLTGVFDREPGTTYAGDAVHYSPLGNRRLAEALLPLVEQRLGGGPLPAPKATRESDL